MECAIEPFMNGVISKFRVLTLTLLASLLITNTWAQDDGEWIGGPGDRYDYRRIFDINILNIVSLKIIAGLGSFLLFAEVFFSALQVSSFLFHPGRDLQDERSGRFKQFPDPINNYFYGPAARIKLTTSLISLCFKFQEDGKYSPLSHNPSATGQGAF